MRAFAISFVILVHCCFVHAEQTSGKVIIEYQANAVQLLSKSFLFYPVNKNLSYDTANLKAVNGWVRWEKIGTDYYLVRIPVFSSLPVMPLVEPGDHVRINMHNDIPVFSGKGSEKFQLIYTLERINEKLDKDLRYRKKSYHQDSVTTDDYQLWNHFLDGKKKVMVKLIESFKGKLSLIAYDYIKAAILTSIEEKRMEKFIALRGNYHGLTPAGLCTLYDSTLGNTEAIWLQSKAQLITTSTYYLMWIVRLEAMFRNYGCDESKVPDSLKDDTKRYVMYYRYAKKRFTGKIREELLAYMFSDHDRIIGSLGFIPETEAMLKDYYKLPGFPEYRKYVKERETAFRDAYARSKPLPFTLTDANDKAFSNDQLKGKTTIIDFWYTGCKDCVPLSNGLRKVQERFSNDSNVVFVHISADKDKGQWKKSIGQNKYTSTRGLHLYTGGKGKNHPMLKDYLVTAYPSVIVIDALNRITWESQISDPSKDQGKGLIAQIEKQLVQLKDGPYVFYNDQKAVAYSLHGPVADSVHFNKGNFAVLPVATDTYRKDFKVMVRYPQLEPCEFPRPEKLLALSDVEGNFDAFRKLLQANNIIDSNLNWTFGNGHLVFSGDMFDRGNQVTECLWLIYNLEEEAKLKGGYVHFILGNHEIMNLQGDHRYVQSKYKSSASALNKTVTELYGSNSALGQWLRTKNIMERIGDLLFLHGGLSEEINNKGLSVQQLNAMVRPYYDTKNYPSTDKTVFELFSSGNSPFWYRGYYSAGSTRRKMLTQLVDSTLTQYNVNHIITGHTIVADTISTHFDNKVINTDTHHAAGKSEALLIEGDKFYRVNQEGRKVLLFIDEKRK